MLHPAPGHRHLMLHLRRGPPERRPAVGAAQDPLRVEPAAALAPGGSGAGGADGHGLETLSARHQNDPLRRTFVGQPNDLQAILGARALFGDEFVVLAM